MNNPDKHKKTETPTGRCKVCFKMIRHGEDHMEVYHGGTYYKVCCASCGSKFEADPAHYIMPME